MVKKVQKKDRHAKKGKINKNKVIFKEEEDGSDEGQATQPKQVKSK